jgi:hypothetical protein
MRSTTMATQDLFFPDLAKVVFSAFLQHTAVAPREFLPTTKIIVSVLFGCHLLFLCFPAILTTLIAKIISAIINHGHLAFPPIIPS